MPVMLSGPSNQSYLTLISLTTDDDSGGLTSTDTIQFYLKYVVHDGTNPPTTHETVILTANLANYQHYSIDDEQESTHSFIINHKYNLNQIQGYQNIKLLFVEIKHSGGVPHGNEILLEVKFTDPI